MVEAIKLDFIQSSDLSQINGKKFQFVAGTFYYARLKRATW